MSCPYTGCNAPEGECSGACMTQQTNSEPLENVVMRLLNAHLEKSALMPNYHAFARYLLADPAILDHIPAVKALREENERLTEPLEHWEGRSCHGDCIASPCRGCDGTRHIPGQGQKLQEALAESEERIADLESQLAELRQGGEAVGWQAQHRNGGKWSNVGIIQPTEDAALAALRESKAMEKRAIQLFTRPQPAIPPGYGVVPLIPTRAMEDVVNQDEWQWEDLLAAAEAITEEQYNEIASAPAIQPAIPPGYAVVPVEPTAAMHGAGDGVSGKCWMGGKVWRAMLAAAPSVPVAEKALPENVKLLLLKAHRQLETEYRQQTRATEAKRVANGTCGESPGGASSIALLAESGYISSIGKRNQEVRDEIFAMLAAPADSKEGE